MRYVANKTNSLGVYRSSICSNTTVKLSYMKNASLDGNHKLIIVPLSEKEITNINSVGINISTQTSSLHLDKNNLGDNSNASQKTTKPHSGNERTTSSSLTVVNIFCNGTFCCVIIYQDV